MDTQTLPASGRPSARPSARPTAETKTTSYQVPDPRRWLVLAVICSASFLGVLDFFIVNVAIPSIQSSLQASSGQVELVIAAYALSYAVLLITGGRLGDLYGRKRLFLIGVVSFTSASALCGLAGTPEMLIAARVLQGAAGAIMFPQVLSIIQVSFPGAERVRAFGILGAVVGAASFTGNVLGGLLISADIFGLGWRPIFLVNLPIGMVGLMFAVPLLHESRSVRAARPDLVGVALASVSLFLLIFPLVQEPSHGLPGWSVWCFLVSAAIVPVFVWYERWLTRHGGTPLLELSLFRDRTFVAGLLTSAAFAAGLSAFFLTFTLFLQRGLKLEPRDAGLVFAPFAAGYFTSSTLAVHLATRLGRHTIQLGAGLMIVALVVIIALVRLLGAELPIFALLPLLLVYGTGQGLVMPTLLAAVLRNVPVHAAGSASGVLSTAQQVAMAIGVAAIGGIFFGTAGAAPAPSFDHAIGTSLFCNIGLLAVTCALVFLLPRATGPAHVPHVEM